MALGLLIAGVLLAAAGWVLWHILHQHGRMLLRLEALEAAPTNNDFDGVYFTLQALRLYQDLEHTELLVIDNYGCEHTKNLVEHWLHARYIRATDVTGTAAPRELVFREA